MYQDFITSAALSRMAEAVSVERETIPSPNVSFSAAFEWRIGPMVLTGRMSARTIPSWVGGRLVGRKVGRRRWRVSFRNYPLKQSKKNPSRAITRTAAASTYR